MVLNVTVAGSGVSQYRYKVGSGVNCSLATGYSRAIDVSVPITNSIATVATYTLCVVGRDLAGNEEAYPGTQYTWSRVNNLPPVMVPAWALPRQSMLIF